MTVPTRLDSNDLSRIVSDELLIMMSALDRGSPADALVLRTVARFPAISAAKLAERVRIKPSALTAILKDLERRNYIRRRPDPRDARRAMFGVTASGLAVATERTSVEPQVRVALAGLLPEEVAGVRKFLSCLAGSASEPAEEAGSSRKRA
jgi:DNA-binding MarR family transcriptional regulator